MAGLLRTLFAKPAPIPVPTQADWESALNLRVFHGLGEEDRSRLRPLARQLLEGKTFTPAAGAKPTGADIAAIAAQAALPILNLGASWYDGWREVVLYPAQFIHEMDEVDEAGVVHHVRHVRSGEAWEGGPLILSLDDLAWSGRAEGYNVVIHEFAHKLDMKNGAVDGLPPLHGEMLAAEWAAALGEAYADFRHKADTLPEEALEIDPYAAESPAEFFAVLSEYFFEWPEAVMAAYPAVYEQLRRFYRQHPLERFHDLAVS